MNTKRMRPLRIVVGPSWKEACGMKCCCVCGREKEAQPSPVCLTCYAGTERLDYPGLVELGPQRDEAGQIDPVKRDQNWDAWISRVFASRN